MAEDNAFGRPELPLPSVPPANNTKMKLAHYPKTTKERVALIDKIMRDLAAVCTVVNWNDEAAVANIRKVLEGFSSAKLMFLTLSVNYADEVPDEAVVMNAKKFRLDLGEGFKLANKTEVELLEQVRKMRLTHDGCRGWEKDRQFMFYRNWLREGWIEMNAKIQALEVVEYAVGQRDDAGKPTLTKAQIDLTIKTLDHFGWTKPQDGANVNVNNFITTPGEKTAEDNKKFEELADMARQNPEAARILAALHGGLEKPKAKEITLVATEDGDIKAKDE